MNKRILLPSVGLLCTLSLGSAAAGTSVEPEAPATIYYNGAVLTMASDKPSFTEALVAQDGRIVFVGTLGEARERASEETVDFDLSGTTLMPGLIEPHLHPSLAAVMLQNEIIAPYDWKLPSGVKKGVSGEAEYRQRILESIKENATAGELYFIWGYHRLWHGALSNRGAERRGRARCSI